MNIEYLGEFVYLADTLSFKRTADHFYVSRSVISRHIAALEEELGVRLVDRDNRAVSLTEAGHVFYREARTLLRDWETALERVRSVQDSSVSLARIGYLRNASRPVLVKFVRHMSEAHPHVRLSLTCMEYGELRRAMEEHTVDVALAMRFPATTGRRACTKTISTRSARRTIPWPMVGASFRSMTCGAERSSCPRAFATSAYPTS